MKMVKLGEIIKQATVVRAGNANYPILSMTMHRGLVHQNEKFNKNVSGKDQSGYKVAPRGALVVGFPIDEAVLDFQNIVEQGIVSPAYSIWDLFDNRNVDREYLGKYLKSPLAINYYKSKLRGSTARRRSLPKSDFLSMPVPLPPLDEQRRIAAILDQSEMRFAFLTKQRAHLRKLRDYILHNALESVENWKPLKEIANTSSGGTPSRADSKNFQGNIPWVKSGELRTDIIHSTEETISDGALNSCNASILPPQTILLAMYGATAGVVSELGVHAATNQAVCAIQPFDDSQNRLIIEYLRSQTRSLLSKRSGGAQPNLSQRIIKSLPMPILGGNNLSKFNQQISAICEIEHTMNNRSTLALELHKSIQSRAFRGEL